MQQLLLLLELFTLVAHGFAPDEPKTQPPNIVLILAGGFSYEECLAVRRHTDHPFVLNEYVDSLDMLLRAKVDLAMDVINLTISKLGGLTKAKQVRDHCASMGIAMRLEDRWGGDITTAAIAHLAHSTPEEFRFTSTDFNSDVTVSTASGAPQRRHGYLEASSDPGLEITPRMDILGQRVVEVT